jgi:hypothetical protein
MKTKAGFVIGFGAGYVLGTRAGRERYEDIRRLWGRVTGSPTVQRAAEKTKVAAGESARTTLHAVQKGVEKAGTAVKDRLNREGDRAAEGSQGIAGESPGPATIAPG